MHFAPSKPPSPSLGRNLSDRIIALTGELVGGITLSILTVEIAKINSPRVIFSIERNELLLKISPEEASRKFRVVATIVSQLFAASAVVAESPELSYLFRRDTSLDRDNLAIWHSSDRRTNITLHNLMEERRKLCFLESIASALLAIKEYDGNLLLTRSGRVIICDLNLFNYQIKEALGRGESIFSFRLATNFAYALFFDELTLLAKNAALSQKTITAKDALHAIASRHPNLITPPISIIDYYLDTIFISYRYAFDPNFQGRLIQSSISSVLNLLLERASARYSAPHNLVDV
jgi:hypothetical protein